MKTSTIHQLNERYYKEFKSIAKELRLSNLGHIDKRVERMEPRGKAWQKIAETEGL